MSNLFAGVYGAKFPEVVMNSGPLPPEGGLPAPLHDTPDARINYGSTLLGDLQPYAYGEAGYMSSQSQNNQPHRIQKIIPLLYLPEPKGNDVFALSHAVDDSDIAFVMRLNRNSIFCTGSRGGTRRNTKVGTTVDPIVNLATLNYLLAGLQLGRPDSRDEDNLWWEFLYNLDPGYWPREGRNYSTELREVEISDESLETWPEYLLDVLGTKVIREPVHRPFTLEDIIHVIKHCIKPFGIVRGSEKQGGQHEMGQSPVTWTVPTIATLVIDGKEANVVNIWHYHDLHAGEDVVLRLKLMPAKTYTLNHYFKGFARRSFDVHDGCTVWQLVPDVLEMDAPAEECLLKEDFHPNQDFSRTLAKIGGSKLLDEGEFLYRNYLLQMIKIPRPRNISDHRPNESLNEHHWMLYHTTPYTSCGRGLSWHQLGFWHIGRTQVQRPKYGSSEYYNDDMANGLKTNHIDLTFQPHFSCHPRLHLFSGLAGMPEQSVAFTQVGKRADAREAAWTPQLRLEGFNEPAAKRAAMPPPSRFPASGKKRGGGTRPPELSRAAVQAMLDEIRGVARAQARASLAGDLDLSSHCPVLDLEDSFAQPCASAGPFASADVAEHFECDAPFASVTASVTEPISPPATAEPFSADVDPVAEPPLEPRVEALAAVPDPVDEPVPSALSEASRDELLGGLPPGTKKGGRGAGKARKAADAASGHRGPVDGTLLRPGAEPEACRMTLL